MPLPRDEDPALGAGEVGRLCQPDVGQQLRDPLAAGPGAHATGKRLRADERRPPGPLRRVRGQENH